jgi:L-2-amino-thiazoline-4-carboxylic acid hydrolase
MSEHQYLNKVTVCRIQKILSECGDSELVDVVVCYPNFAMFRKTNESFRLTRMQLLMNGGCCCATCYHDVRFVRDFEFPLLDVFASLLESSA